MKIRPTTEPDVAQLALIAGDTLFPADMLAPMIAPHLRSKGDDIWLTALDGDRPCGFCLASPEPMTDAAWNMKAIAISPKTHRKGMGRALVTALEKHLATLGAQILVVDTASDAEQSAARAFYVALGYEESGVIPSFWAEGSDKVTFWKAILA